MRNNSEVRFFVLKLLFCCADILTEDVQVGFGYHKAVLVLRAFHIKGIAQACVMVACRIGGNCRFLRKTGFLASDENVGKIYKQKRQVDGNDHQNGSNDFCPQGLFCVFVGDVSVRCFHVRSPLVGILSEFLIRLGCVDGNAVGFFVITDIKIDCHCQILKLNIVAFVNHVGKRIDFGFV